MKFSIHFRFLSEHLVCLISNVQSACYAMNEQCGAEVSWFCRRNNFRFHLESKLRYSEISNDSYITVM